MKVKINSRYVSWEKGKLFIDNLGVKKFCWTVPLRTSKTHILYTYKDNIFFYLKVQRLTSPLRGGMSGGTVEEDC
jgi:hypothetical protein